MSSILSVDTSSESCSVALLYKNEIFSSCLDSPRQHSQQLLPLIDQMMSAHHLDLSDLDAIAYGRGPGSFTGLRICLGVVQGLAFSCDTPVIPVSTLQTMATGAMHSGYLREGDRVLTVLDARMSEVYWSLHQVEMDKKSMKMGIKAITDEFVSSPLNITQDKLFKSIAPENLVMIGSGCHYPELSSCNAREKVDSLIPKAEHMLFLAAGLLASKQYLKAEDAHPVYLRDSVAWKKRQRIRTALG